MAQIGEVYFRPDFKFADGGVADKLLVVLAEQDGCYVMAKTTSKQHQRTTDSGCQKLGSEFHSFHIPQGGGKFNVGTWICLDEYQEVLSRGFDANAKAGVFQYLFSMDVRPVLACALSDVGLDVTKEQEDALRASHAALPPA